MKNLKQFTFILLFGILSLNGYSQVGASYYLDNMIGVNTRLFNIGNNEIATEARITKDDTRVLLGQQYVYGEFDVLFRFAPRKYHQISFGVGLNLCLEENNEYSEYVFPIVLEVYPFAKFKRASILLELAPVIETEGEDITARTLIGFRYIMGKHKRGNDE